VNNGKVENNKEIINLLYDDSFLGYNSSSSGSYEAYLPVGCSENATFIEINNLSLPIYAYQPVNINSQEYQKGILERFFPQVNITEMKIELNDSNKESPFIRMSNDKCHIDLLKSGAVEYWAHYNYSQIEDNIRTKENATAIALNYLKNHGGIPSDIRDITITRLPMRVQNKMINGTYSVKIYRKIDSYDVMGNLLCNQIYMKFDATDGGLVELLWHWPNLKILFNLTDMPMTTEIMNHYQMNSGDLIRNNITNVSIIYYVPPTIQESAYDTRSDVYLLAPYLMVQTEKWNSYILGIMLPEEYQ
jgi:hypothetical protein